jgi:hypothetical protein
MAQVQQLFLSCVSAEFRRYRELLRHNLSQTTLTVQIQEDFIAGGTTTLEKLDLYIQSCDAVIHLVGEGVGALAKDRSLSYLRSTYPNLATDFPALAEFLQTGSPSLSYTQWEAWLAVLHSKQLLICRPTSEAPREEGYVAPDGDVDQQNAHLARLRHHELYSEIDFSNPDNLTWQIQRSINVYLSRQRTNPEDSPLSPPAPLSVAASSPLSPFSQLETITLMVLVADSGESSQQGSRYHLTPELDPPELNSLPQLVLLDCNPCDNVALEPSNGNALYIGDCLKTWLTSARSLAQQIADHHQHSAPPEVVLELFLPNELLLLDCGGLKLRAATRMRPMANTCPFVVRSLNRARDHVDSRDFLSPKWEPLKSESANAAGLLLVHHGPPAELRSDLDAWDAWHEALYDRVSAETIQACIYLPDPETDSSLTQSLLGALMDACIPLVLLWPGGSRSSSLPRQERLNLVPQLLTLDPALFPPSSADPPDTFEHLHAPLPSFGISRLALERRRLIGAQHPASNDAVLVMDVPHRWPRSIATSQPSDQLRAPL